MIVVTSRGQALQNHGRHGEAGGTGRSNANELRAGTRGQVHAGANDLDDLSGASSAPGDSQRLAPVYGGDLIAIGPSDSGRICKRALERADIAAPAR
jgi:hypothetical protein